MLTCTSVLYGINVAKEENVVLRLTCMVENGELKKSFIFIRANVLTPYDVRVCVCVYVGEYTKRKCEKEDINRVDV